MRLFIAIPLTAEVQAEIACIQERLHRLGLPFRSLPAEQLHLTLRFLGETPDELISELEVAITESAHTTAPFEIMLNQLGYFPPRGRARVLWLGTAQPIPQLMQLHSDLDARLGALGLGTEERPFAPHITFGRMRGGESAPALEAHLRRLTPPLLSQHVASIALYSSQLSPQGAEHLVLFDAPLKCPDSSGVE